MVSEGREVSDPRGFRAPPQERDQSRIRPRIFEPDIPEDVTGEELEKSVRAELLSLSAENAKVVARHMVCVNLYMDVDPELAHKHAVAAAHHAGRLAVVRETAGYAAYRAGHYEIALKELRAANRISGDVSMWPVMADCERGLGNPLKALSLAGSPEVKRLDKAEEIEMRIVASGARRDLGEVDAAVVTLQCKELKNESDEWAVRLRYAYADSLEAAGRLAEAIEWFSKCAAIDHEESTDAQERAAK
jgi:tetratricopeptide (TPR) repeat protein